MMNKRLGAVCDAIIQIGLPLTGVWIVLAVNRGSMNPLYVKTLGLHAGTALVFAAWVIKRIERRSLLISPALVPVLVPAALFMLSAVISYLFVTPRPAVSHEELVQRIPYFLVFLVALTEFAEYRTTRRALRWLFGSAAAAAVIGMIQHFQVDLFGLKGPFIQRIPSTFGNPNFYVGFLALVLPLLAAVLWQKPRAWGRALICIVAVPAIDTAYYVVHLTGVPLWMKGVLFAVATAAVVGVCVANRRMSLILPALILHLLILNVLITSSRSGQIALAAGLSAFLVLVSLMPAPHVKPVLRVAVPALVVAALAGAAVGGVYYFSMERENSVSERKYYVLGALELIGQRPLLGHGIGTFKVNYPLVKPHEAWAHQTLCFANVRNVYNEHLEVVHDEGAVGGIIYLWLLGMIFVPGLRALRRADEPPEGEERPLAPADERIFLAGALAGIAALLVSNAFSLSMRYVSTGFHFWYLMGLAGARIASVSSGSRNHTGAGGRDPVWSGGAAGLRYLLYLLLLGGCVAVTVTSARTAVAGVRLAEAVDLSRRAYRPKALGSGEISHDIYTEGVTYESDDALWARAIEKYVRVLRLNPRSIEAHYFLGNAFNRRLDMRRQNNPRWGDPPGVKRTDAQRALEQYAFLQKHSPHYTEMDYELGNLYRKLGQHEKALHYFKQYKKYKPYFIKINCALARCYRTLGRWEEAEAAYLDALDNNEEFTMGNVELSIVYHILEKPDLEKVFFDKAFEQSPAFALTTALDEYTQREQWDAALDYCNRYIDSLSSPAPFYYRKGWIHVQRRQWEEAAAAYEKTAELAPTNVMAYINLSNVYYAMGSEKKAQKAFDKAMELDPRRVEEVLRSMQSGN